MTHSGVVGLFATFLKTVVPPMLGWGFLSLVTTLCVSTIAAWIFWYYVVHLQHEKDRNNAAIYLGPKVAEMLEFDREIISQPFDVVPALPPVAHYAVRLVEHGDLIRKMMPYVDTDLLVIIQRIEDNEYVKYAQMDHRELPPDKESVSELRTHFEAYRTTIDELKNYRDLFLP